MYRKFDVTGKLFFLHSAFLEELNTGPCFGSSHVTQPCFQSVRLEPAIFFKQKQYTIKHLVQLSHWTPTKLQSLAFGLANVEDHHHYN
jgi:hypothetical protein